jgi:hypothetical protein
VVVGRNVEIERRWKEVPYSTVGIMFRWAGCQICVAKLLDTRELGTKFLNKQWWNVKEKVAYKKVLRCTDQTPVKDPGSLKTK